MGKHWLYDGQDSWREHLARERVLIDVAEERRRQEALKAEGRFLYTCADGDLSWGERVAILVEEVGEVAREALAVDGLVTDGHRDGLRKELIQVMAISLACVEFIDG